MVKSKNPLFSLDAHNSIGKAISFVKRRGQKIAEKKPKILDVQSPAQLSWRHMYQKCAALWHGLSVEERKDWKALGTARHMTGFAYWQSQCLRPNPGIYLPLQGGTMQGDIDMDGFKIEDLPDPLAAQEAATKAYVDLAVASMRWDLSFNDTVSGIDSYFEMSPSPTGLPESTFTAVNLGGGDGQPLFQWVGDDVVTFVTIEAGTIGIHIHAQRTAGNRSIVLYAEIYEYKADTSEALIATTEISAPLTNAKAGYSFHATLSTDYDIAATSKLLVKILANIGTTGANVTVALYAEGDNATRISIPVPTGALDDIYLRISAYGLGARVYHDAAQSIPHNTNTILAFNSERYDTDNVHSNITNNSRLTCKTAGKYLIGASLYLSEIPNAKFFLADILLGGSTSIAEALQMVGSAVAPRFTLSCVYALAVNDYVEIRVKHDSGNAELLVSAAEYTPEFWMQRIG